MIKKSKVDGNVGRYDRKILDYGKDVN